MNKLFKILEKMQANGVDFCFQCRTKDNFYNLKVITPQGREKYLSSNDIAIIEDQLFVIWGHLIGSTANGIKIPAPLSVPIPPPMPTP